MSMRGTGYYYTRVNEFDRGSYPPGVTGNEPAIAGEQHEYSCDLDEDSLFDGEFICRELVVGWIAPGGFDMHTPCGTGLDPSATFCPGCGATRWDISLPEDPMLTGWEPRERICTCLW